MDKDIVERLRKCGSYKIGDPLPDNWWPELDAVLMDAATEIKILRGLAGVVSGMIYPTGGFREITKDLPRSDPSKHQVG